MKKPVKIALSFIIGFAVAMILMSIAIYFGFSSACRTDAGQYTVRLLGISIYTITKSGTEYAGAAIGPHMGMVCGICMLSCFVIAQIICKPHSK